MEATTPVLFIDATEVRALLPMADCIEVMDRAMRAVSDGGVQAPDRLIAPLPDGCSYFIAMPGMLADGSLYGAKLVSLHPGNPAVGPPAVQGFVALFDGATGTPTALVDGAEITRIRTAAASALATRTLARPDALSHGIFGAGVQAAAHLEAIACVCELRETRVWARDPARSAAFVKANASETSGRLIAVQDPAEAAACDIVSLVTNAAEPVLQGRWLRPGAHINAVGAHQAEHREADSDTVLLSAVYADSRTGVLREGGDLLIPIAEGLCGPDHLVGEIGEVLLGRVPGRRDSSQLTFYKSLGLFAQDLFAAAEVLERRRKRTP